MDPLANFTLTETRNALEAMIRHAALHHQGPWRVESDWTEEVVSDDGTCVAKVRSDRTARLLVNALNQTAAEEFRQ